MGLLVIVGQVLQFIMWWVRHKVEKDEAKRKKQEKALSDGTKALKAGDASALTASLDELNKLR